MANRYVFYTLCAAIMFFTPIELIAKKYEYDPLGPPRKLTKEQSRVAEANYEKYCTLCHGEDRQG
ncbi:MAG: hypothetical protein OQJ89_14025, partial [Kangiellaceae bacterium]|nr:hypothetical protein [Kangiellaceae bacterium]